MSLINEALKRARQVQGRPAPGISAERTLEPVAAARVLEAGFTNAARAAAFGLLILAMWFLWMWWQHSRELTTRPHSANPSAVALPVAALANTDTTTPALQEHPARTADPEPTQSEQIRHGPSADPEPAAAVAQVQSIANVTCATVPERTIVPEVLPRQLSKETPAASSELAVTSLKLQGIFYRAAHASVLINGETLFVGDEIEGAKLLAIERQCVRILLDGKTNVLRLR